MGDGKVYIEIGAGSFKRFPPSPRVGPGALTRTGELLDNRGTVRSWALIAGRSDNSAMSIDACLQPQAKTVNRESNIYGDYRTVRLTEPEAVTEADVPVTVMV
jgi:hypothetical protein